MMYMNNSGIIQLVVHDENRRFAVVNIPTIGYHSFNVQTWIGL